MFYRWKPDRERLHRRQLVWDHRRICSKIYTKGFRHDPAPGFRGGALSVQARFDGPLQVRFCEGLGCNSPGLLGIDTWLIMKPNPDHA
jgi:hypothetical protein